MIQRIQSLSLFIAAVLILLAVVQISYLQGGEVLLPTEACTYGALAFRIIGALVALFSIIAIFRYKSRKCQQGICMVNLILLLCLIGTQVYLYFSHQIGGTEWQELFPLFSLFCTFDARRRIKNDEALVRAADRLR